MHIVSLYTQLQAAKSEEDVKDAYIKALGLKGYTKGLIDIQAKEIWFEAKDTGKNSSYAMFTQLLHYVQDALNKGEAEVNATDRFESDFMVQYLADKTLSPEATAVLDAGRVLWKAYFAYTDVRSVREQCKLNRADVGWYQIRNALAERNKSGDTVPNVPERWHEQAVKSAWEKIKASGNLEIQRWP